MKKEPKKDKFRRLASRRTTNVLNQLRLLGNLSNKANYDYNEADIKKIFRAVDDQLRMVKAKFKKNSKKEFKL